MYIKEIHSTDGWQVGENVEDGVLVREHQSFEERIEVGQTCMLKMALQLPAVVDEMDDSVAGAYAAMPERLYLIERGGRVAYQGGMGPMFFRPDEWEAAMETLLNSH